MAKEDPFEKVWYLDIDNKVQGPYSIEDLKLEPNFNPDLLVWKEGMTQWIPARDIEELREVFKDKSEAPHSLHEQEEETITPVPQDELAIEYGQRPPFYLLLWIIILMIIIYSTYLLWN